MIKLDFIVYVKSNNLLSKHFEQALRELLPGEKIIGKSIYDYKLDYINRKPKLVIIDIDPYMNVSEIMDYFKSHNVVVIVDDNDHQLLKQLFVLNLKGYLYKNMGLKDIQLALEMILDHKIYIHPVLGDILLTDYIRLLRKKGHRPKNTLTNREWEILELIMEGKKTKEMGEVLHISPKTVANHISSIYKKLNVCNRVQAVTFVMKQGWVLV